MTEPALITAAYGRRGRLETAAAQNLRYLVKGRRLKVVCGDQVAWHQDKHGHDAIVTDVLPRTNCLERLAPDRPQPELLAANLTCVAVVIAPLPATDWHLVDRYLVAAELMQCRAILVDNKSDSSAADIRIARAAQFEAYRELGYASLLVSAATGDGIDALAGQLVDEIAILVGQSGVGKSSLINRLVPDADIVVGDLSAATAEGTHTTTASAMHRLPGGGRLIDTPGVRDFVPAVDSDRAQLGFPEIRALADECRFANCRHIREPDCAIKHAVTTGTIDARRYETYKRLAREK
ncbi:MAG: ribosome small subunit-dependent GTPase A [Gammaproteobacteria bacterium]|nr:ribosome small subunit-dependent GTPase A [Gammaproteobacteria bacterium]